MARSELVKGSNFIPACGASAVMEDPEKILNIKSDFDTAQESYRFVVNYLARWHRATPTELHENCRVMFGLDARSVRILCDKLISDGKMFKVNFGKRYVYLDHEGVIKRTHMFEWLSPESWNSGTAEDHMLYLFRYGRFCSREEFSKLIGIPSKTLKYYMQSTGFTSTRAWKGWATQRKK